MPHETVTVTQSVNSVSITDVNAGVDSFGQLSDTVFTSVGDNEILQYDAASSKWINQTITEAGAAALSGATFTGEITHQGLGSLTSGVGIDQLVTYVVNATISTTYSETGISFGNSRLPTGTYAMLLHADDQAAGGGSSVYYSGLVSLYGGTTSADDFANEVPLHRSGGDDNDRHVFVRTKSSGIYNNVRIQMKADYTGTQANDYTFKFRRLI